MFVFVDSVTTLDSPSERYRASASWTSEIEDHWVFDEGRETQVER